MAVLLTYQCARYAVDVQGAVGGRFCGYSPLCKTDFCAFVGLDVSHRAQIEVIVIGVILPCFEKYVAILICDVGQASCPFLFGVIKISLYWEYWLP